MIFRDLFSEESLYVSEPSDEPNEAKPVMNSAYENVLRSSSVHTPDGTEVSGIRANDKSDCGHLSEFVRFALKVEDSSEKIRKKRSSSRLLVLLAGIGEGKTTLLEYFSRIYIKQTTDLKNLVRINLDFEEMVDIEPSSLPFA